MGVLFSVPKDLKKQQILGPVLRISLWRLLLTIAASMVAMSVLLVVSHFFYLFMTVLHE